MSLPELPCVGRRKYSICDITHLITPASYLMLQVFVADMAEVSSDAYVMTK